VAKTYTSVAFFQFPPDGVSEVEAALDRLVQETVANAVVEDIAWAPIERQFGPNYTHTITVRMRDAGRMAAYRGSDAYKAANAILKKWDLGHVSADFLI
jgi:hypothetical protein